MTQNSLKITINKPIHKLFIWLLDPKNTPLWVPSIVKEERNEETTCLGTIYRNQNKSGKWNEYKITEFEEDKLFTFSLNDGNYNCRYTFKFLDENKTELIYSEWVKSGVIDDPFTKEILEKLKKTAEGLYRFSPIKDKIQLFEAIKYIHFESYRLCRQNLGYLLPVAGNIGVFCHYDEEYKRLIKIRKELTNLSDNWNQKYFRLHEPIVILARNGIPKTTYNYLYVRKPDPSHYHVGGLDFYLKPDKYQKLKQLLSAGKTIRGVRIFERSDLDLVELYDSKSDICAYVGQKTMIENVTS